MSTTVTFFEELRIGKNSPKGADFLRTLQAVADTAKELGGDIECIGEFLPEERTNHGIEPFTALRIAGMDGKIEISACRF